MTHNSIAISSAHGLKVGGAVGVLNEVTESRRVVTRVAQVLRELRVTVATFNDDTSTSVKANLDTIVAWHNRQNRTLDCSIHFNAFKKTDNPMGVEVLHLTQPTLAGVVSKAIATAGKLINRGAKRRTNLAVLNRCAKPTLLLEVCFVDSTADAAAYRTNFEAICTAIAESMSGKTATGPTPEPEPEPEPAPEPEPPEDTPVVTVRVEPPGSAIVVVIDAIDTLGEV